MEKPTHSAEIKTLKLHKKLSIIRSLIILQTLQEQEEILQEG